MSNTTKEIGQTFEEYKKVYYIASGEARIYPCWVLPEEEVLRIMKACNMLEEGKNE